MHRALLPLILVGCAAQRPATLPVHPPGDAFGLALRGPVDAPVGAVPASHPAFYCEVHQREGRAFVIVRQRLGEAVPPALTAVTCGPWHGESWTFELERRE